MEGYDPDANIDVDHGAFFPLIRPTAVDEAPEEGSFVRRQVVRPNVDHFKLVKKEDGRSAAELNRSSMNLVSNTASKGARLSPVRSQPSRPLNQAHPVQFVPAKMPGNQSPPSQLSPMPALATANRPSAGSRLQSLSANSPQFSSQSRSHTHANMSSNAFEPSPSLARDIIMHEISISASPSRLLAHSSAPSSALPPSPTRLAVPLAVKGVFSSSSSLNDHNDRSPTPGLATPPAASPPKQRRVINVTIPAASPAPAPVPAACIEPSPTNNNTTANNMDINNNNCIMQHAANPPSTLTLPPKQMALPILRRTPGHSGGGLRRASNMLSETVHDPMSHITSVLHEHVHDLFQGDMGDDMLSPCSFYDSFACGLKGRPSSRGGARGGRTPLSRPGSSGAVKNLRGFGHVHDHVHDGGDSWSDDDEEECCGSVGLEAELKVGWMLPLESKSAL